MKSNINNILKKREYDIEYRNNNKEKIKNYQYLKRKMNPEVYRRHRLKKNFNLTIEQYDEMFKQQNGLCAICRKPETALSRDGIKIKHLAVDHNHITGKIRGLLCMNCNNILGKCKDNIELLKNAIDYLEEK